MSPTAAALRDLLDALDAHVERRVLLSKQPGERRVVAVIIARDILPAYDRARAALARLDDRALACD